MSSKFDEAASTKLSSNVSPPVISLPSHGEVDSEKIDTLMRHYNSATSSTTSLRTTTTLPKYDASNHNTALSPDTYPAEAKELLLSNTSDTSSIHSAEPAYTLKPAFRADKIFQINAQGKKLLSFPAPSKELEITINELPAPSLDLVAKSAVTTRYKNIRPKRSSGSGTLWHRSPSGNHIPVAETTYRFGPGKPPVIKILSEAGKTLDEFELKGVSTFNRTIAFESKLFGKLQWEYYSSKERKEFVPAVGTTIDSVPYSVIVLQKIFGTGKDNRVIEIARLIRNEELRTVGTGRSCAGNGGRLELAYEGLGIDVEDESAKRNVEALVLASVLVMLKKEIDRMRTRQIAVMVAIAGSS